MQKRGNRRLLSEWLIQNTDHEVLALEEIKTGDPLSVQFDLCIVDPHAVAEYRNALKAHRECARPEYVPVLLLVPRNHADSLTAEVWEYVDDIIWTSGGRQMDSLYTFELEGRIKSLLRVRTLSRSLVESQQQLKVTNRVLRHNLRNSLNVI